MGKGKLCCFLTLCDISLDLTGLLNDIKSTKVIWNPRQPEKVYHDDVIEWKYFPRYWPFVWWIQRSPVNSLHKGQSRGALKFSLVCACINGRVNNREAGDLRRHRVDYDVSIMLVPAGGPTVLYKIASSKRKLGCASEMLLLERIASLYGVFCCGGWASDRGSRYANVNIVVERKGMLAEGTVVWND